MVFLFLMILTLGTLIAILPTNKQERAIGKRRVETKFVIPKEFWDECNKIDRMIYEMDADNINTVFKYLYSFQDKYVHLWDNKTYTERMTNYIVKYNSKALLLTKKTK